MARLSVAAVGVDACRKGWIAVTLREGAEVEAHYLSSISMIADTIPDAQAIAIDMPIGLPHVGRRQAEVAARAELGNRRNSVFFTPVRAALGAASHASATAVSMALTGSGISRQSYALREKIFEVEQWLPTAPCGVWEVHPELSFSILIGAPAHASKKTWAGMIERRNALLGAGIDLDPVLGAAADHAAIDDMLDAGVAAWTARRLVRGVARAFPAPPEVDESGQAIWA